MGIKYTMSHRSLSDEDVLGYYVKADRPGTWKVTTPFRIGHVGRLSILLVKTILQGHEEKTKDAIVQEHLLTVWIYPLDFVCGCIDHSEDLRRWRDI